MNRDDKRELGPSWRLHDDEPNYDGAGCGCLLMFGLFVLWLLWLGWRCVQ